MPEPKSDAAVTFGERLRDQRVHLAVTQEEVAHLAGMNVSNYGKIERGQINPRFYTIVRLAHVLEMDPGTLMRGISGDYLPESQRRLTAQEFVRERLSRLD